MESIIILIFVIGYLSITLEHPLRLDKTVPALLMAALIWGVLAVGFHAGWFDVIDTYEIPLVLPLEVNKPNMVLKTPCYTILGKLQRF